MSASCLDVVAEFDEHWASQIRQRKFQMHNKEWLEVIDEDEAEEYEHAVRTYHLPTDQTTFTSDYYLLRLPFYYPPTNY